MTQHYSKFLNRTVVGQGGRGTLSRVEYAFDETSDDQNKFTFDLYELRASAAVIPIDDDGNIYLLNEFAPGVGAWQLTLARGGIDKEEEPIDCARRECIEEMGLSCATLEPLWAGYMVASISNWHVTVFVGRGITEVQRIIADEPYPMNVIKMPLAQAVANVMSGEIKNAVAVLAVMMVAKKYDNRFLTFIPQCQDNLAFGLVTHGNGESIGAGDETHHHRVDQARVKRGGGGGGCKCIGDAVTQCCILAQRGEDGFIGRGTRINRNDPAARQAFARLHQTQH
jgi:ADP-ribose pyrophosphatase